jgi:hypothetical protein
MEGAKGKPRLKEKIKCLTFASKIDNSSLESWILICYNVIVRIFILPIWVFWLFLIGGFLAMGYSFIPRRDGFAYGAFLLGLISIFIAFFLWISPSIVLR